MGKDRSTIMFYAWPNAEIKQAAVGETFYEHT